MANSSTGDGYSEWQQGLALLFGVLLVGAIAGVAVGTLDVPYGEWIGGAVGAVLAFVAISYLLYGR